MKNVFLFLTLVLFLTPMTLVQTPTTADKGISISTVILEVSAQEDMGRFVNCSGKDCNACHLVQMGNEIVDWLIGLMMVIFSIIVAYAGFLLVVSGGNPTAKSEAKKKMTNAFIGIVIVLAAWILIDTIMKALVPGGEIDGRAWSEIQCLEQNEAVEGTPKTITSGVPISCEVKDLNGSDTTYECDDDVVSDDMPRGCVKNEPIIGSDTWTCPDVEPPPPTGGVSEGYAISKFNANDITYSSTGNNCTDRSRRNCTGLEGLQEETIQNIIDLKNNCNCDINVTGGTEIGHAENDGHDHSSGYKYDISLNAQVDSFIKDNYVRLEDRGDGALMYKDAKTGTIYARESNHWDIQVN